MLLRLYDPITSFRIASTVPIPVPVISMVLVIASSIEISSAPTTISTTMTITVATLHPITSKISTLFLFSFL